MRKYPRYSNNFVFTSKEILLTSLCFFEIKHQSFRRRFLEDPSHLFASRQKTLEPSLNSRRLQNLSWSFRKLRISCWRSCVHDAWPLARFALSSLDQVCGSVLWVPPCFFLLAFVWLDRVRGQISAVAGPGPGPGPQPVRWLAIITISSTQATSWSLRTAR